MRVLMNTLGLAALLIAPAEARELAVASVTPQGVACVFTKTCAVQVTDSYGTIRLFGNGSVGHLLTRTYAGMPGTQAAGLTGYSFHLDMSQSTALGTPNCVERLIIDTGPVASLKYAPGGGPAQVFVVAGQGSAGLSSVSQSGTKITFTFAKPICPMMGSSARAKVMDCLYFGFAAKDGPVASKAQVVATMDSTTVDARVPKH